MLSKSDVKLILALEENGRASYAQLAKQLSISVSTVAKRVKALLDSKIIAIKLVPNPYKMGYTAHAIIAMNVHAHKIDDVCARLKVNMNVNFIVTTFGRFNLIISVFFPTWDELHEFISSKLSATGDIYEIETFFVKDNLKRFERFFAPSSPKSGGIKIDDINMKIIRVLSKNGRYSGLNLANDLGISVSSVSKRLSNLLKENIIMIRAITNPTKVGYHANAFLLIRADHKKIDSICARLQQCNEAITVLTLINGYDIYASIVTTDHEVLYDLIKKYIAPIPGILSMETLIRGEIIKRYYGYFRIEPNLPQK